MFWKSLYTCLNTIIVYLVTQCYEHHTRKENTAMFTITYMPSYVYQSLKYNKVPLETLTDINVPIDTVIENTKSVTDLDLLHWKTFNKNNIFSRYNKKGYNQPIFYRLARERDTVRYTGIDIKFHLEDSCKYEIITNSTGIIVVIYGKNIDYKELTDEVYNTTINLIGYSQAVLDNILNCYIPYITAKLHVRRNKNV